MEQHKFWYDHDSLDNFTKSLKITYFGFHGFFKKINSSHTVLPLSGKKVQEIHSQQSCINIFLLSHFHWTFASKWKTFDLPYHHDLSKSQTALL